MGHQEDVRWFGAAIIHGLYFFNSSTGTIKHKLIYIYHIKWKGNYNEKTEIRIILGTVAGIIDAIGIISFSN